MRTTEIWKGSLRSIKSIWLCLVSNFPAQDFPVCFQSPLFKRSNFRTCWTSCSSYWLNRETRFWKPKRFVRDRKARTETAVIGWRKAVVYQKSDALRGEKGMQQLSLNEEHRCFAVRNQKALWRSGWHMRQPQSWILRRARKGGCRLKSTSCGRFTCKGRSTFHFVLWPIISSLLALMMWRHFSIKWFLTVQLPKILEWQNATAITNSVLAPESVNSLMKA